MVTRIAVEERRTVCLRGALTSGASGSPLVRSDDGETDESD